MLTNLNIPCHNGISLIITTETGDAVYSLEDGKLNVNGTTVIRDSDGTMVFGVLPGGDILFQAAPMLPVMIYSISDSIVESVVSVNEDKLYYVKHGKLICIDATEA